MKEIEKEKLRLVSESSSSQLKINCNPNFATKEIWRSYNNVKMALLSERLNTLNFFLASPRPVTNPAIWGRKETNDQREGVERGGKWRDYLNIPYLRFVRRSPEQWLPTWQAGHVAGTSYTSNQPPMETAPIAPKAASRSCERFTFYFHAVLTPMYATFLTYSPDIGCWHVLDIHSSGTTTSAGLLKSHGSLDSWEWTLLVVGRHGKAI